MLNEHQQRVIRVMQDIDAFQKCTTIEIGRLFRMSKFQIYEPHQRAFIAGKSGQGILILLQGKLKIVTEEGRELGEILPGMCIGELEQCAGLHHRANIISIGKSAGLHLPSRELQALLDDEPGLAVKILTNILKTTARQLDKAWQQAPALRPS